MANVRRPRPRWLVYLPLIGHIAPTIIIGYGIVIPQSCIAGLNAQTLGFATAIIGFVAAYVAGIRIARRQGVRAHA